MSGGAGCLLMLGCTYYRGNSGDSYSFICGIVDYLLSIYFFPMPLTWLHTSPKKDEFLNSLSDANGEDGVIRTLSVPVPLTLLSASLFPVRFQGIFFAGSMYFIASSIEKNGSKTSEKKVPEETSSEVRKDEQAESCSKKEEIQSLNKDKKR